MDVFLKQKNPADIISLYMFYYYTAKWQDTNQPKCSTGYTAKGLNKSEEWVRKNKKTLLELNLIQDIQKRDKETNKVTGWYIKLNYIWKQETIDNKTHPTDFPQGGNSHRVENHETNALSANSLNALSANSLNTILDFWNQQEGLIKHKPEIFKLNIKKSHRDIIKTYGEEQVKEGIRNYAEIIAHPDRYYFSHKYNLWDFIKRKLDCFITGADPLNNFLRSDVEKPDPEMDAFMDEIRKQAQRDREERARKEVNSGKHKEGE